MYYQMECGHTAVIADWPEKVMQCTPCARRRGVTAVEIRQHHIICNSAKCTFGRWMGDDASEASRIASRHELSKQGHSTNVDYMRFPADFERLRRDFPAKVKPYILRASVVPDESQETGEDFTDIPPF